jgi:hypothetical protein
LGGVLACDGELHDVAGGRRGGDLALVPARVPVRDGLDLEKVVFGKHLVDRLEAEVRGVRETSDRQEVRVRVTEPRDLKGGITDVRLQVR